MSLTVIGMFRRLESWHLICLVMVNIDTGRHMQFFVNIRLCEY